MSFEKRHLRIGTRYKFCPHQSHRWVTTWTANRNSFWTSLVLVFGSERGKQWSTLRKSRPRNNKGLQIQDEISAQWLTRKKTQRNWTAKQATRVAAAMVTRWWSKFVSDKPGEGGVAGIVSKDFVALYFLYLELCQAEDLENLKLRFRLKSLGVRKFSRENSKLMVRLHSAGSKLELPIQPASHFALMCLFITCQSIVCLPVHSSLIGRLKWIKKSLTSWTFFNKVFLFLFYICFSRFVLVWCRYRCKHLPQDNMFIGPRICQQTTWPNWTEA